MSSFLRALVTLNRHWGRISFRLERRIGYNIRVNAKRARNDIKVLVHMAGRRDGKLTARGGVHRPQPLIRGPNDENRYVVMQTTLLRSSAEDMRRNMLPLKKLNRFAFCNKVPRGSAMQLVARAATIGDGSFSLYPRPSLLSIALKSSQVKLH
jgi:hypothetical protein